MGLNVKELLIGLPVLVFVLWVFSAPIPQQRIDRGCQPINWVGNIATSTTALVTDSHTTTAARWSEKLTYSCQYTVWRLFYQDAYNQAVKEGRVAPAAETVQDSSSRPADAATPQSPATTPPGDKTSDKPAVKAK